MTLRGSILSGGVLGFFGGVFVLMQLGNRFGLWPLLAIPVIGSLVGGAGHVLHRWMPQGPVGRRVRSTYFWLRAPLDHGPSWATWVTLAWVTIAPAIVVFPPIDSVVRITAIGFTVAVFGLLLGSLRPRFFWLNGIVEGWRWFFGDRGVVIIYIGLGSITMLADLATIPR